MITLPKRRPKRLRVLLDGYLETIRGQQEVRVRDISKGGVLIETSDSPSLGEKVRLLCSGQRLEGVVVWQEGSWSGIEFERSLGSTVWDDFSNQPMRVAAPRNYRHDEIADDDAQIEVTPRSIRLRRIGRKG